MRNREHWNIKRFADINLPEAVLEIQDKEAFSDHSAGRTRVLDLPVFMPGQGLRIPETIRPVFANLIKDTIQFEVKNFGPIDDHYVYTTIDQKIVTGGNYGRRPGAHSDAYVEQDKKQIDINEKAAAQVSAEAGEVSHTYIVSDCLPTEFFATPFSLEDTSCEGSLRTFDEICEDAEPITYGDYTLLRLDPYVIHRSQPATHTQERTFMKVSISRKKYSRAGNTINSLFDYDWAMDPRSNTRNHPWSSTR